MEQIRKRRVFYVSGFDPRGAAAYHRMFREESRIHAAQHGLSIQVGKRGRDGPLSTTWNVERQDGVETVSTTFEFLHWDDISRRHWHTGVLSLYALAFKTYWHWLVASDFLVRVLRLSKWNFLTGIAPALVLFLFPLIALLAAWAGHGLGYSLFPQAGWTATVLAATGVLAVTVVGWWLGRFFSLAWLLRTYGFVIDYVLGRVPELDERIARFEERLIDYLAASDDDEVLIVGHSVGANVAVSLLARALTHHPMLPQQAPRVGLLTLGGSIPMQGLQAPARNFRAELALLAACRDVHWVDVSAKQDVASFALLNPVTASGVDATGDGPGQPLVVSGAFRERLSPENYDAATWDVFRMHFQYLMAGEVPFENDYLSITTDGLSFRERFDPRAEVRGLRAEG